jgi:hypothetical protein
MPSATASTPLSVVKYFFSSLLLFILGAKVRLSEQNAKFIWIFSSKSTFDEVKIIKKYPYHEFFRQKVCTFRKIVLPLHPQIRNDAHLLQ